MKPLQEVIGELSPALDQIEAKLVWEDLPLAALEEFKMTLDGVRTSLLALVSVEAPTGYAEAIQRVRIKRATDLCRGATDDVIAGMILPGTVDFTQFAATVRETLEQVEQLIG